MSRLVLERPWSAIEQRLLDVAQKTASWKQATKPEDQALIDLGLVDHEGELTSEGQSYYMARFVLDDSNEMTRILGDILTKNQLVTAFCEPLWAREQVPVVGAVSLLIRLGAADESVAKRWLSVMNMGQIVAYNRRNPNLRVLFNPTELVPPAEEAEREKSRGHVISPDTPYGNIVAVRELIRSARGTIRWYEQHMPGKVMEPLYREIEQGSVTAIRLLSGPANITRDVRDDFKRFRTEMRKQRGIEAEWRVLDKKEALKHHDRLFLAQDISRNIPPVNSILANSSGEILDSNFSVADFDSWWAGGVDIETFQH
jgi:hypothetical protein